MALLGEDGDSRAPYRAASWSLDLLQGAQRTQSSALDPTSQLLPPGPQDSFEEPVTQIGRRHITYQRRRTGGDHRKGD
jgi:hypothetical protein